MLVNIERKILKNTLNKLNIYYFFNFYIIMEKDIDGVFYNSTESKVADVVIKSSDVISEDTNRKVDEVMNLETISINEAKEIFGDDFIGPEQFKNAFGFVPEDISEVPFSKERLIDAKQKGLKLNFHVDKSLDGELMTIENMSKMQISSGDNNSIINGNLHAFYNGENFYNNSVIGSSWTLDSDGILPDSTNKNMLEQFELIVEYLKNDIFNDIEIPESYLRAFSEFEDKKDEIKKLIVPPYTTPGDLSGIFENLELSKLVLPNAPEMIQTMEVNQLNSNNPSVDNMQIRARIAQKSCHVHSLVMDNKIFDKADASLYFPSYKDERLGVYLSLKK